MFSLRDLLNIEADYIFQINYYHNNPDKITSEQLADKEESLASIRNSIKEYLRDNILIGM